MIAFGEEGNTPRAGMVTMCAGLGLTNRVIFDQHFRQRDRLGRLLTALAYNPLPWGSALTRTRPHSSGPTRPSRWSAPAPSRSSIRPPWTHSSIAEAKSASLLPCSASRCMFSRRAQRSTCTPDSERRHLVHPRQLTRPMEILDRRHTSVRANMPISRSFGSSSTWAARRWPTCRLGDGFIASLLEALPGLRGAWVLVRRAWRFRPSNDGRQGTWLRHVVEHVAIELQKSPV